MNWNLISDLILCTSLAVLAVFAFLGLYQWISRRSLKKVDRELLAFFVPLILMLVTFFIFDKIIVLNTRPDGSGASSFPSSHVMTVTTIFLCVSLILPRYVKSKATCITLGLLMLALIIVVSIARVLSGQHWASDVFAALIFAGIFATIYYLIIRRKKECQASSQKS